MYLRGFEKLGRRAQPIGVHSPGYVADTDERASAEFWAAYEPLRNQLAVERGLPAISKSKFEVEVTRGALYVGSPETVARRIAATMRCLSASCFDLKYSTGRLPHERLLHSVELYGRKVIPLVRDMLQG